MIKSFEIDHTKLEAPCIRLADIYERNGVVVKKYDIRFVKPNTTIIEDKIMHSMEHLLATAFKNIFKDDMIDLSPMGCKTGFYFTCFDNNEALNKIQEALVNASSVKIPTPRKANCGSSKLHNVTGARRYLESMTHELWTIINETEKTK